MPTLNIPIIKGDITVDNADYRDALPVNLIAVSRNILDGDGYLLSHSGLTEFATGKGADRGGYWNERLKEHIRVSGNDLVIVGKRSTLESQGGGINALGLITGTDQASMVHSFNHQAIVADGKWWLYDGLGLTQITDPDLGKPIDVTWIDSYFFFTDGEFIYHTNINDETQIDPLKFATSEFSPDPTLAVEKTADNQVIVFNRYTTEYFVNRATEFFAFRRVDGKSIKCGIVGTHAQTEIESVFYVLGSGREENVSIHYIAAGYYKSVATREVDKIIAKYNDEQLKTAVLETRIEDKDRFLIVRLPDETLIFNLTIATKMGIEYAWSILKSDVQTDQKWRGVNGVYDPRIPGWIYGDNIGDKIGYLDNTISTEYGTVIESVFYSPIIRLENKCIDKIEIDTIPGHQLKIDDVTCAISISYDGFSYGAEWWALYGRQSKYRTRFIQYRLGYVRENVAFKIRCASPERLNFTFIKLTYG